MALGEIVPGDCSGEMYTGFVRGKFSRGGSFHGVISSGGCLGKYPGKGACLGKEIFSRANVIWATELTHTDRQTDRF